MGDWVAVGFGVFIAWHVLADEQIGGAAAHALSAQNRDNLVANFVRSVRRAEPALHWIREQSEIVDDVRQKRHAQPFDRSDDEVSRGWSAWGDDDDEVEANYDADESVSVGEESWYNSFRQSECKENAGAYCTQFRGDAAHFEAEERAGNGDDKTEAVDWFETYKNYGNNFTLKDVMDAPKSDVDSSIMDEQSKSDPASTPDNLQVDNYNGMNDLPTIDYTQHFRTYRHLEDQLENTRNDLSHEAQYKLSKNEQENGSLSIRRKRSINSVSEDQTIQIQPNNFDANLKQDDDYDEDDAYNDAEIEDNIVKEISHKRNCSTEPDSLTTETIETTASSMVPNENQTEQVTNKSQKNRVGITVEVKINNVTKNRIQTVEDLQRRKKDVTYRRRPRNKHNDSLDDLISGKLPGELVNAAFEMIRSNEKMKQHIRPLININDKVKVFNPATKQFQSKLKANGLVTQIMASMNDIIRDQVNDQTCVTLRPDLQRYVDDIREFYTQERLAQGRSEGDDYDETASFTQQRRHNKYKRSLRPRRYDRNSFARNCNRNTIHEKYFVIIGLLEQFEQLDQSDQQRVIVQKHYLEDHLQLLDELEAFVQSNRGVAGTQSGDEVRTKKNAALETPSGQFNKLARMVELMRHSAMLSDAEDEANEFDKEYEAFVGGADYA